MKKISKDKILTKTPPVRSKNIFSDIKQFLLHKPERPTLVKFKTAQEREAYSLRIMQRLGLKVSNYSVLNVHKIGVEAPVKFVFEELLRWSGHSTCWPNHIAKVYKENDQLEKIQILLFGRKRYLFGIFSPLFYLNAIRIQKTPNLSDYDNARYLLYKCSGGYPIGIFTMYVRSPFFGENEIKPSQLHLGVGFDFYGKERHSKFSPMSKIWEAIHNRVTTNTLNRFKQFCEWQFEQTQMGR
nr:hypothetical protein [Bacteroidota bacterium]